MAPPTLTIGEVARQAGLKASAIRFYEQAGLLPKAARIAGQRRYTEAILDRLALIDFAKHSGFKLEEIRLLFHGSREGIPLPARWQRLAAAKIPELDRQIERIVVMKRLLQRIVKCRCIDVEECGRSIRKRGF